MNVYKKKCLLVLTLLTSMVFGVEAQTNKSLQLDLSATPFLSSFTADNYSASFNLGVFYPVAQSFSCGLQFRETYEFNKIDNNYDALSSIGLGVGYVFFEGKKR